MAHVLAITLRCRDHVCSQLSFWWVGIFAIWKNYIVSYLWFQYSLLELTPSCKFAFIRWKVGSKVGDSERWIKRTCFSIVKHSLPGPTGSIANYNWDNASTETFLAFTLCPKQWWFHPFWNLGGLSSPFLRLDCLVQIALALVCTKKNYISTSCKLDYFYFSTSGKRGIRSENFGLWTGSWFQHLSISP